MTKESDESSAKSKEQCDASGQTVSNKSRILRCLRTCGPNYPDGRMTQNEVFRELKRQGRIKPGEQVSSLNPGFSRLRDDDVLVIQKQEDPSNPKAHLRYDPITKHKGTLWKPALPGATVPGHKEKKQFFLVNSVTALHRGPYTKDECAAELSRVGARNWIRIKISGSKRYTIESEVAEALK